MPFDGKFNMQLKDILDIPDVEVVVNYSFPLTTEDYVHRIGQTGKKGVAHTFFMQKNKGNSCVWFNLTRD